VTELIIERSIPGELLESVGDGWTVYGRAVPYDVDQEVSDDGRTRYLERFAQGAFSRDAGRGGHWVNLMVGHTGDDGDRYLGRCVDIQEQRDGLFLGFRLDRSHPQAEAARHGELTKWSVSAHVYRTRVHKLPDGREVYIREACGLSHVAATDRPQYAGAGVLVAREHEVIETVSTPILDAARARMEMIRARHTQGA
jgi:HK97 family phage prohead protease